MTLALCCVSMARTGVKKCFPHIWSGQLGPDRIESTHRRRLEEIMGDRRKPAYNSIIGVDQTRQFGLDNHVII